MTYYAILVFCFLWNVATTRVKPPPAKGLLVVEGRNSAAKRRNCKFKHFLTNYQSIYQSLMSFITRIILVSLYVHTFLHVKMMMMMIMNLIIKWKDSTESNQKHRKVCIWTKNYMGCNKKMISCHVKPEKKKMVFID